MRCKLNIENKTDWNTRDLRRLIMETMKQAGYDGRAYQNVTIAYNKRGRGKRGNGYHGQASLRSNNIWMYVPKPEEYWWGMYAPKKDGEQELWLDTGRKDWAQQFKIPYCPLFNSEYFAKVLKHELDHNTGLEHKDMGHHTGIDCSWAKEFIVNPKAEPTPKVKRDLVKERYQHTIKMLKIHKTKLNRQENIVKKWSRKVSDYEKRYPERCS